ERNGCWLSWFAAGGERSKQRHAAGDERPEHAWATPLASRGSAQLRSDVDVASAVPHTQSHVSLPGRLAIRRSLLLSPIDVLAVYFLGRGRGSGWQRLGRARLLACHPGGTLLPKSVHSLND